MQQFFLLILQNEAISEIYVNKNPNNKANIHVTLPTKQSGPTIISGYSLPLLDNDYESKNRGNFEGNEMVRMVTTTKLYLSRVYKSPADHLNDNLKQKIILGFQGTWLTNEVFGDKSTAMKRLALLPEWYRVHGEPDTVATIEVPVGTEIYVGVAGKQMGAVEKKDSTSSNTAKKSNKQSRKDARKKDKSDRDAGYKKNTPKENQVQDFRLGGGAQILVPPKHYLTKKQQLTKENIIGIASIK